MGIFGWILYIILGIILFFIMNYISNKYKINRRDWVIISIIFMMIFAGLLYEVGISDYNDNIFLVFVFMMITDIFYNSYVVEEDFFNKEDKNIYYYVLLLIIGFIINQCFINEVDKVFLTGNDLRIVLWLLVIVYIYKFFGDKNILSSVSTHKSRMSVDSILVHYVRFKNRYYDECNYDNKDISLIIYSLMIYEDNKRSKFFRNIDNFKFRVNGEKCKLGIMQVDTNKFISDSESINITYKNINKLYNKYSKKKSRDIAYKVIDEYAEDSEYVKYIYDIIKKF